MSDIATRWDVGAGTGDWALSVAQSLIWTDERGDSIIDQAGRPVAAQFTPGTGLVVGDELLTAVLISLFTDASADLEDTIPDGTDDPRGWWAGPIGSKLWLRLRSKATPTVAALVKHDSEQALAWLVEDSVAAAVEVTTEWTRPTMLGVQIIIRRTSGDVRALAFSHLWETI
ncbi:phage GP46 family protein [Sphingomonas bacterium]|uniref:phage GP46 family protein n=1 Tax=Sphingomonas bacterium TaxID=1895847 RepID=UPI001576815A|nr:phage GP46 family protein [Sphingomonas bacterium]